MTTAALTLAQERALIEADPETWLAYHYPRAVRSEFSPHHRDFWRFVAALEADELPEFQGRKREAFVAIWPRGHAKSTSGELACAYCAATRRRRFAVVVSATRNQANERVSNVAALLQAERFRQWYPDVARRQIRQYGAGRWSVSHLQTDSGFNLRAFGLDIVTALCERLLKGGAPGLHFYSMNQSTLTLEICKRLGIQAC